MCGEREGIGYRGGEEEGGGGRRGERPDLLLWHEVLDRERRGDRARQGGRTCDGGIDMNTWVCSGRHHLHSTTNTSTSERSDIIQIHCCHGYFHFIKSEL